MSECPPAVTRRGVLAAGAAATTAGCGSLYPARDDLPAATDWPVSGHDPRGSYQTPATGGPTAEPRVQWTTERGGALLVREPIVYDGSLYPGRFSDLRVDTDDGTTDRRGVAFRSPPAVVVASSYRDATLVGHRSSSGDGAFPGTPDTALVAFRRDSSRSPPLRRRWRYPRPPGSLRMWDTDSPATVVPVGDRVVVGGSFDIETEAGNLLDLDSTRSQPEKRCRISQHHDNQPQIPRETGTEAVRT